MRPFHLLIFFAGALFMGECIVTASYALGGAVVIDLVILHAPAAAFIPFASMCAMIALCCIVTGSDSLDVRGDQARAVSA